VPLAEETPTTPPLSSKEERETAVSKTESGTRGSKVGCEKSRGKANDEARTILGQLSSHEGGGIFEQSDGDRDVLTHF